MLKEILMIRGLNMEQGLENTGGDLAFYKALLQDFFNTYSKHPKKIIQFVSEGDYHSAELEAHSLKGTSRMLGLEKVYDMAFQMELSLKEKDKTKFDGLIQPMKNELKILFRDYEGSDLYQESHEDYLSLKLNDEQKKIFLDRINALRPVVKAGRYQAETLVSQLLKDYADFGLNEKLSELKALIEQLEFEEALALIKTIQKEL
jgi:HPt (histidine-containing phosphotransfer) domain-containing protein